MENFILLNNLHNRNVKVTNAYCYDISSAIVASGYPVLTKVIPRESNESDVKRAIKLANTPAGTGHSNFLVGIRVSFDLTAPRYIWQEAQRYHWFDIVSSQSTMHKITSMDLRLDMFTDDTPENAYDAVVVEQMAYQQDPSEENFRALKAAVPEGLMLTARISTNYQQLRTIFTQRCHHRLPLWQEFCEWIRELPYGKELITNGCPCAD